MAPENRPPQQESSIPTIHIHPFLGAKMLVSGRVLPQHWGDGLIARDLTLLLVEKGSRFAVECLHLKCLGVHVPGTPNNQFKMEGNG